MNPRLFMLGIGIAVGYVLGTRDGRERYDAMKAKVVGLWEDPRVTKARTDVEAYAREQGPIIRDRAEAAAKAAPGVVADVARDVSDKVASTAKDVAEKATTTAKDIAEKATSTAKDIAEKATTTAKDVASKVTDVAADLRERGETAVGNAAASAGEARENVMDVLDDEDDPTAPAR